MRKSAMIAALLVYAEAYSFLCALSQSLAKKHVVLGDLADLKLTALGHTPIAISVKIRHQICLLVFGDVVRELK